MNILLTGASGFLGKTIISTWGRNNRIITLGQKSDNEVIVDLSNEIPVIESEINIVIHAAGKAHFIPKNGTDIASFNKINVEGTKSLLKAIENQTNLKQFVFISSVAVYGLLEGNLIDENSDLLATEPYGISKIAAEKLIIEWCKNKNISYYILRLPLIIGNNAPGNLGAMVKGIKNKKYARIGKGDAKKSMVLATDIVNLLISIKGESGIYNLTDGYHPSFKELEDKIGEFYAKKIISIPNLFAIFLARLGDFFGINAPINSIKLKKITSTLTFSDEKARRNLNWNPNKVLESWNIQ
jgi:nucleoside-diphosphate-sugar epimerase